MNISELKRIAKRALAEMRDVRAVARDVAREVAHNPRALSARATPLLGPRLGPLFGPWLERRLLGVASNVAEPFTVGMGLKVESLGEDLIEVSLPGGWRNQGEGGTVHSGALAVLGEFAVRLYWEHHLDLRRSEMSVQRVQVRLLNRAQGAMRAVFRLSVAEREAIQHRLRSDAKVDFETQTAVYDNDGRLIAEVDSEWTFRAPLALT